MIDKVRSWFSENQGLVYFLVAQATATLVGAASLIAYSVNLENRVTTLETRGSPHLQIIDGRLTVLESKTATNKESIDRIVTVMTKALGDKP
jgi:uncharacterized coiled-coil protein SlyX